MGEIRRIGRYSESLCFFETNVVLSFEETQFKISDKSLRSEFEARTRRSIAGAVERLVEWDSFVHLFDTREHRYPLTGMIAHRLSTIGRDSFTAIDEPCTLSDQQGKILQAEAMIPRSYNEPQQSPDPTTHDSSPLSPPTSSISSRKRHFFHPSRFYQIPSHIISC